MFAIRTEQTPNLEPMPAPPPSARSQPLSRRSVTIGAIRWVWSTNVVCAGPNDRLIVTRGLGALEEDASAAILEAARMEWRDGGFRRWRLDRKPEGIVFTSHYEKLGPVALDPDVPLARLSDEDLEAMLASARRAESDGH